MKTLLTLLLVIILLFCVNPMVLADAGHSWSKEDSFMQTIVIGLIVIDWAQTRYIADNPERYCEDNPILGKHPDIDEVDRYFAACLIGNTLIAYILPERYRKQWQTMSIWMQVCCVANNYGIGAKLKF